MSFLCNIPFVECDDGNDTAFEVQVPAKPVVVDGPTSPMPEPGSALVYILAFCFLALWLRGMKGKDPREDRNLRNPDWPYGDA